MSKIFASRAWLFPLGIASSAVLIGCAANPGPPPVETPTVTTTTTTTTTPSSPPAPTSSESIGIDPVHNGFNPHLIADDSAFTRQLAKLLLPSTFRNGLMDTDLLVSAKEIPLDAENNSDPKATYMVRYEIRPEAQWSDGTPITGADFVYLWNSMVNTPGVIDPAGYHLIRDIKTTSGGKVVEVSFTKPVATWRELFHNLLPSHLFPPGGEPFNKALGSTVPASAGRYMVNKIDRQRGIISLNRNDRFWGKDPALVDHLEFREIRNVTQSANLLRSGQLSCLNITPAETTTLALGLVPDTVVDVVREPRRLDLVFSTISPYFRTVDTRKEFASAIDVELVAKIAAGRSSDLAVGQNHYQPEGSLAALTALAGSPDPYEPDGPRVLDRPLRIAVDPTDDQAATAAQVVVDQLRARGVNAEVMHTDFERIVSEVLPEGEADAVLSWLPLSSSPIHAASRYGCLGGSRASNLSGYCAMDAGALLASDHNADEWMQAIESTKLLSLPILQETRVRTLSTNPYCE